MLKKGKKKVFSEGDEVMARWPGSKLWYDAVVLSTNYEEDLFQLRFPDGQENEVPLSNIANKARFRGRSTSPSRRRRPSPSRRKRSRSKSPGRSSPRKKSPAKPKNVTLQQQSTMKDLDEKPAVGEVTVSAKIKVSKVPAKTTTGQQMDARVTRSALKQLEKHGVDTEGLRQSLGEGLHNEKPSEKRSYAFHYAFGGPLGVILLMLLLPCVVFSTYLYCNNKKCYHLSEILKQPKIKLPAAKEFFDPQAAAIIYGWIFFQVFLSILPVGKVVEGLPLDDGNHLKYRVNGFYSLVVSIAMFGTCLYFQFPVSKIVSGKFLALITHAFIFSIILALFLFIKSYVEKSGLSKLGNSGNIIYDFFMGRQLNPRIGSFDMKFFCEMRPGLIGLVIIDLSMLLDFYKNNNGQTNGALLIVCIFHFLYILDALWFEAAILSTPDITKEGFGFMLSFGHLVWVPFIFSLQSRYLAQHSYKISPYLAVFVCVLNFAGFVVYRVANLQKDLFRRNPDHPAVQHLTSMVTLVPDSRLLISGWWGYVRHPNYLGDIIMGLAWSLTCGFNHAIPYFYPVYLILLLLYRSRRFEAECRVKYGANWDEYCRIVPYRIFPNVL